MMTKRWIKAAATLIMATGIGAQSALAADCSGRPCINIGAMNIKFLGNGGPANSAAEYKEIARLLASTMNLDVIVLEEIDVGSDGWRDLEKELDSRGYTTAFESAFGGDRKQFIVVLYRKSIISLIAPVPRDLPFPTEYREAATTCAYESVRPPVAAAFRAGQFDFRVIGVHMKSNLPVGQDTNCDDRIRTDQARKIAAYAKENATVEPDIIILGDFNSSYSLPENAPFRDEGFRSAMDDLAPGSGNISFINSPRSLIDQIIFRRDDDSYVHGSGMIYKLAPAERQFYLSSISDHVPIRASFYTDRDDD